MTTNAPPPGPPDDRAPVATPEEGLIVGRFELEERIGGGRLGQVWRARDLGTGVAVALRFVNDGTPDVAARLENEMRAWRWVRQRNLVPITEVVEDRGLHGVVSPLVEGTPLADVLQDGAAMELSEAIPLFRALLEAMTTAHAAGRVHGALHPANVLLEIDEVRINPRLIDAGLAVALGIPVETNPDRARYVAPEVGVDGSGSIAADIFALGAMLYEMVCGTAPFADRPIPEEGKLAHPPLDTVVPDCPSILARAVDRALAADPADRFASVVAFKTEIAPVDRWLADEPTQPFMSDWSEPPLRSSIRTRTLAREGTDPGRRGAAARAPVAAPAPPPEVVPLPVVPVPVAAPVSEAPLAPPRAGAPPAVVPVARTPMVIQLSPEHVVSEDQGLVRDLDELNAAPTRSVRWGSAFVQYVIAPLTLLALLVGIQSWRAGAALHDARLAAARARADVDADVAASGGYVERLVALGASRETIEPQLLSARREKDLLKRSESMDSYRALLSLVARQLPPQTAPEGMLEQRTLQKGIDGLGGNGESHLAAVTALAEAESMPLAGFADRWGFAEDDAFAAVTARLLGGAPVE